MRFDLGTLDSGEGLLPFGLLVSNQILPTVCQRLFNKDIIILVLKVEC